MASAHGLFIGRQASRVLCIKAEDHTVNELAARAAAFHKQSIHIWRQPNHAKMFGKGSLPASGFSVDPNGPAGSTAFGTHFQTCPQGCHALRPSDLGRDRPAPGRDTVR